MEEDVDEKAKDTSSADLAFLHEQRAAELLSIFYEVRKRLHHDGGFKELALDFPIKELVEVRRLEWISLHQNWRPMSWADMGGHRQL